MLEGSIQRQGDSVRVTGQLIDAGTGAHVWSERWDRPAGDVFAVQTEVAEKVAAALGGDLTMGQITRAELQRAKRLRPNDLTAYDYFQLGKELKATASNIDQGIEYLTKAITLDPQLARAYSIRAWLHNFSIDVRDGCGDRRCSGCSPTPRRPSRSTHRIASRWRHSALTCGCIQGRWAEAEKQFALVRRDVSGQLAHPDPGGVRVDVHRQGGRRRRLSPIVRCGSIRG